MSASNLPDDKIVIRLRPAVPDNTPSEFGFKQPVSHSTSLFLGFMCMAVAAVAWWYVTSGETPEDRILSYSSLPSPAETFDPAHLQEFWTSSKLPDNLWASLQRVIMGFALATCVGVPIGVLCGCYPWMNALMAPVNTFGRNIPIAALIPLTFALFGIGEFQKTMFIFIATVAFIMVDTATAISDVSDKYIDTGLTLGASRRQIVTSVLVPLAMPRIFNSLRLLFGLAFGYIMLAELVTIGGKGGLGYIINTAQRRGHPEVILLVLMIIPAVALLIDRTWYMAQRSLFPFQYKSRGLLHKVWRGLVHLVEDTKQAIITPKKLDATLLASIRQPAQVPNVNSSGTTATTSV